MDSLSPRPPTHPLIGSENRDRPGPLVSLANHDANRFRRRMRSMTAFDAWIAMSVGLPCTRVLHIYTAKFSKARFSKRSPPAVLGVLARSSARGAVDCAPTISVRSPAGGHLALKQQRDVSLPLASSEATSHQARVGRNFLSCCPDSALCPLRTARV